MTSTTMNGRPQRKSLAEQIDRLDAVIDALSEGLNEAVATVVAQTVRAAVQVAIAEVLADAELRRRLSPPTESPASDEARGWWGKAAGAASTTLCALWSGARWVGAQAVEVACFAREYHRLADRGGLRGRLLPAAPLLGAVADGEPSRAAAS